jgi:hypothetical protein
MFQEKKRPKTHFFNGMGFTQHKLLLIGLSPLITSPRGHGRLSSRGPGSKRILVSRNVLRERPVLQMRHPDSLIMDILSVKYESMIFLRESG